MDKLLDYDLNDNKCIIYEDGDRQYMKINLFNDSDIVDVRDISDVNLDYIEEDSEEEDVDLDEIGFTNNHLLLLTEMKFYIKNYILFTEETCIKLTKNITSELICKCISTIIVDKTDNYNELDILCEKYDCDKIILLCNLTNILLEIHKKINRNPDLDDYMADINNQVCTILENDYDLLMTLFLQCDIV